MHQHPLIRRLRLHDDISDDEVRILLEGLGPEREIRAGEDMVNEGDRPWQSIVVLEGLAARYKLQADGTRQIAALHIAGDYVDLQSFVLKVMDHSVMALSRCRIVGISHDALYKLTTDQPHLMRVLWLTTAVDGAIHRQWLVQMGGKDARARMAHLLCELFARLEAMGLVDGQSFEFRVTQVEFGDMLGLSSVHVNRTLQQLRGDGLIEWNGGVVTINDWQALRALANFDANYLYLFREPR